MIQHDTIQLYKSNTSNLTSSNHITGHAVEQQMAGPEGACQQRHHEGEERCVIPVQRGPAQRRCVMLCYLISSYLILSYLTL